jgi:hypothetical protein
MKRSLLSITFKAKTSSSKCADLEKYINCRRKINPSHDHYFFHFTPLTTHLGTHSIFQPRPPNTQASVARLAISSALTFPVLSITTFERKCTGSCPRTGSSNVSVSYGSLSSSAQRKFGRGWCEESKDGWRAQEKEKGGGAVCPDTEDGLSVRNVPCPNTMDRTSARCTACAVLAMLSEQVTFRLARKSG